MDSMFRKRYTIILIIRILAEVHTKHTKNEYNCHIPEGCRKDSVLNIDSYYAKERDISKGVVGVRCDVIKRFQFRFTGYPNLTNNSCTIENKIKRYLRIEFYWSSHSSAILDRSLHMFQVFKYAWFSKYPIVLQMVHVKGFEINFLDYSNPLNLNPGKSLIDRIICFSCTFRFFKNGKPIESCDELKNQTESITSIFQIQHDKIHHKRIRDFYEYILYNGDFKYALCPLFFKDTFMARLTITGLANTFYKKNELRFSKNERFPLLSSQIYVLQLNKIINIHVDSNLINPDVFSGLLFIYTFGSITSVSEDLFASLKRLCAINFQPNYFRKLMHRTGLGWIKAINRDLHVNLSDINDMNKNIGLLKNLRLNIESFHQEERIKKVFPDEDFCIYVDFPFDQLVLLLYFNHYNLELLYADYSCTYLWFTQHFVHFMDNFTDLTYQYNINKENIFKNHIIKAVQSDAFKSKDKCKFKQKINLCNKTNYKIKNIWDRVDYFLLNEKIRISNKILTYIICIFGLVTNIIGIITINNKKNIEIFKGLKQYSYLSANMIFNVTILLIEILSWTTECFYPFQVFCPGIRKFLAFQYMKKIIKECFATAVRFMCNFSYFNFAFCRISLLGKDQGGLTKFMSNVGIKKYIVITFVFSSILSIIKFFKFIVNKDIPSANYPILIERDTISLLDKSALEDVYFIINSISDLINYVLFVLVCMIIDIVMVHRLRLVIEEKKTKLEKLSQDSQKTEAKKKELDDAVKQAIKFVVINTSIGLLFKLPISIIPIINTYAQFYFKNLNNQYNRPGFNEFYIFFQDSGFYSFCEDLSNLLFMISISIQLFIFLSFDTKLKSGFDQLFPSSAKSKAKN